MLDHPHQQSYYWFVGNFHDYLHTIINFITPFFLKILQRNSKPVILGNLGMSSHKHLKRVSIWRNLWCLSAGKKSASSFMFSLRHCKDIANLLFWVLTVWLCKPKCYYQLAENFHIYKQKTNFIPHTLLEFWVLWACLPMHNQNDSINLWNTSMFICKPKIHFIIHFFLEILHFKESCNSIGQQHFGQ